MPEIDSYNAGETISFGLEGHNWFAVRISVLLDSNGIYTVPRSGHHAGTCHRGTKAAWEMGKCRYCERSSLVFAASQHLGWFYSGVMPWR